MEIKNAACRLAEGVKINTVPPLFTEYLTINRLTKSIDLLFCNGNIPSAPTYYINN